MTSHIFSEKIQGRKLIHYKTEAGISLVVGKYKIFFDVLEAAINTYLDGIKPLKIVKHIKCKQSIMNAGVRIIVCNCAITVGQAFRLYNEIIDAYKLEALVYGKLFYEQDLAIEISPIGN